MFKKSDAELVQFTGHFLVLYFLYLCSTAKK